MEGYQSFKEYFKLHWPCAFTENSHLRYQNYGKEEISQSN